MHSSPVDWDTTIDSVVPCPPCVCFHSQQCTSYISTAATPTAHIAHHTTGRTVPWRSGMGSGQSPVVNILITTSALQNCCHHSRTHHRRGQSQQLSAGLWFNFIDELADLFLHHRQRDQPPLAPSSSPSLPHSHSQPLSPRQVRYGAAWNSSCSGATPG